MQCRLFSAHLAQVQRSFKVAILFMSLGALGVLCDAAPAAAQQRLVVPGEYIITPAVQAAASVSGPAVEWQGLTVKETLMDGSRLVLSASSLGDGGVAAAMAAVAAYDESDAVCQALIADGVASSCEQNQIVSISATTPGDPRLGELWGLIGSGGIDAPRGWDYHTGGGAEVVVAVVDTGIDYNHPDLYDNMWRNPGEIPGNGIDDDGNGVVDDVFGYNAITLSGNPMDDNNHGTHVAGTIGARGNNGLGVVGVNWQVKLMGLKFLSANGSGSIAGAIRAIDYMVMMRRRGVNIRVSNNSWGGPGYSAALEEAISRASAEGIIFVAAAGNEANNNDTRASYPANYEVPLVVSVAATDAQRNLATFSNYGANSVDIAAPGVGILSTVRGAGYSSFSGTSMATPHVAGALALLLAYEPGLTANQAVTRLYETAIPYGTLQGLVRTGRGLDLGRLMANEAVPVPAPAPIPASCQYGIGSTSEAPDYDADSGAVLLDQVDEFNYRTVVLPFDFPFDGVPTRNVVISPNGVLYMGGAPSGMDWQNGGRAPQQSLAVLHTDLVSTVKVFATPSKATFVWVSSLYANPGVGQAVTRLSLYPDGSAHMWYHFSSSAIENAIRSKVTVGVHGRNDISVATYSSNDKKVKSGLGLRLVPLCGASGGNPGAGLQAESVRVWGLLGEGRRAKVLTPGKPVSIRIKPSVFSGSGVASAALMLDGELCAASPQVLITPGQTTSLRGRLAKRIARFKVRKFTVVVAGASGSGRITAPEVSGAARKSLTPERFETLCQAITSRLKVRSR